MKKRQRIETFIKSIVPGGGDAAGLDPCYLGYFQCFNRGDYYEAHDVLEHLWLETAGPDHRFFKGLIQIAGAFVHLRKQHLRPNHPTDGRRLHPAARLFRLGLDNIAPFRPQHHRLDVDQLCTLCESMAQKIERDHFNTNPWDPGHLPSLTLGAPRTIA